jgi:hypothetical protein
VGNWTVVKDGPRSVLRVDGRAWKKGNPAAGFTERARTIYGSRHQEFIESVQAFAYSPYAVAPAIEDFQNGEISMRFRLIEGALDQCAGILFNLKSNGDYWTIRFNDKEDNLVLWKFEKGKRGFVKKGEEDVPLPMKEWHRMKVGVKGRTVTAFLDDKKLLTFELPAPVSGKVGVWSKTDSVSDFDEFRVSFAGSSQ